MKIETLAIGLLKRELGTQMRAKVDDDTVEQYADLWKAKHDFPPLDVFHDGEQYILADGFHRLYGAEAAKKASVPCRIHKGTVRDAILFACGANHDHGLHRSRADKRTAVESLLDDDEWGKRSARWIAEQCKVSNTFVSMIVADRKPSVLNSTVNVDSSKVESKDGKKRPATSKKLPSQSDEPPTPAEDETALADMEAVSGEESAVKQYGDTFDPPTFSNGKCDLAAKQAPYDAMLNAITSITKHWNAVTEDERDGVYAVDKKNRVNQILKDLRPPIAQARPHALCDHCEGKGCKKCHNCGWWPRSVVEGLKK
jgi:hypothetical protein